MPGWLNTPVRCEKCEVSARSPEQRVDFTRLAQAMVMMAAGAEYRIFQDINQFIG